MIRYVVISGGGSGIGLEISKDLKSKGYTPILLGRDGKKLELASKSLDSCPYLSVDLSNENSIEILKKFYVSLSKGSLVGLVNNAGIYRPSSIKDSTTEDWITQYTSNVLSAVYCVKAFIDDLKKYSGSIVNISSTLSSRPILNTSAYSASKAALNNFTSSLALEYAKDGVRANTVCPGIVNTPIHKDSQGDDVNAWKGALKGMQPLNRVGEPSDIAPLVSHLISDESKWTTGTSISIDGGILLNS